jgi:hypothetical protein
MGAGWNEAAERPECPSSYRSAVKRPSLRIRQSLAVGRTAASAPPHAPHLSLPQSLGWFGRSVAIGAVTGLIGTTITYSIAATSTPQLPAEKKLAIANLSPDVQAIYEKGYADKVRARRKSTSLKGGLLGTAAFVVLLLSSGS